MTIRIQQAVFDVGAIIDELRGADASIGAIASFVGLVRDLNDAEQVSDMVLEHYPGMTERALEEIEAEARGRWDLVDVAIIHRVGVLRPTDPIVAVVVASAHRADAFSACEFIMDYLKTRAPFWKKESTASGERWVGARESDDRAARRWRD